MRFTVHAGGRLARGGIPRATIEAAVETALALRGSGNPWMEDHETGKTYRGDEIADLEKLLRA